MTKPTTEITQFVLVGNSIENVGTANETIKGEVWVNPADVIMVSGFTAQNTGTEVALVYFRTGGNSGMIDKSARYVIEVLAKSGATISA